jgi:hypothetical protein
MDVEMLQKIGRRAQASRIISSSASGPASGPAAFIIVV